MTSGPNAGSGRYSLGTDAKCVDKVRIRNQGDLVTALPLGLAFKLADLT